MIQPLLDALAERGYDTMTAVQEAVTKPELAGADLLVSAQTGSGKTVGFGLAIGDTLLAGETRLGAAGAPLALIVAPTRELALQVATAFETYAKQMLENREEAQKKGKQLHDMTLAEMDEIWEESKKMSRG